MGKWLTYLKSYLSGFRKVKKVKEKPEVKQLKQTSANVLVYGLLGLIFFVGVLGTIRTIGFSSQVSSLKKQVETFQNVVKEVPKNQNMIDTNKVRQYMWDFLKVYINYSDEMAQDRMGQLDSYYSFPMSDVTDSVKAERVLTGQSLIGVKSIDDFYVADVKLSYETIENNEKVNRVRVLAVPFKMDNDLLSIVSPPYFKEEDSLLGETEPFVKKKSDEVERVDEATAQSVKEFLQVFFDKYAASDQTDLSLIMKEPFLMGGQYEVESINDGSVLIYEKNKSTVVQLSVTFKDKGSGALHTENFTLRLVQQDSGWFVEDLVHYYK